MAVFLSRTCLKLGCNVEEKPMSVPAWSETLSHHTEYSQRKMKQIAVDFISEKMAVNDWSLKALKKKYDVASFDIMLLGALDLLN